MECCSKKATIIALLQRTVRPHHYLLRVTLLFFLLFLSLNWWNIPNKQTSTSQQCNQPNRIEYILPYTPKPNDTPISRKFSLRLKSLCRNNGENYNHVIQTWFLVTQKSHKLTCTEALWAFGIALILSRQRNCRHQRQQRLWEVATKQIKK